MRRLGFMLVLAMSWDSVVHAQDVGQLISESDSTIQDQINVVYDVFQRAARDHLKTSCEAFDELQRLKDMTDDKGEIVTQLAIFTAVTESEEDTHVMLAGSMLDSLNLPASIPIRVLAPYLDAKNRQLRDFSHMWFQFHDGNSRTHGKPPLGSVNYYDYMQYVRSRFTKNEEIPTPFIEYIYEQHPGKALLVFAYGARAINLNIRPAQRQNELQARNEMELSERVVSSALWLKDKEFSDRFQKALPEATAELAKLAKHDQWWARLYVAEIMRQHRELRDAAVLEQLRKDSHALVSKTAKEVAE